MATNVTLWRSPIETLDCSCLYPETTVPHDKHEAVVTGHGVYVTPSSWQVNHQLSLIRNRRTGTLTLVNHTTSDALSLSQGKA